MPWIMVRDFEFVGLVVLECARKGEGYEIWLLLDPLMVSTNKALLNALVERWSPITQTFHLLVGEIGVSPIDLYMMTGLAMDGTPPPSLEEFDLAFVAHYIGPQSIAYYKGTNGVLTSWFENDYVWAMDVSLDKEKAYSTWVFLLYMLTRSIFYGKSDKVYFHILPALEDLTLVVTWT